MSKIDDDCDACEELKQISKEAGGLQWGAKRSFASKKPPPPAAAASNPSASSSLPANNTTHSKTTPQNAHKPSASSSSSSTNSSSSSSSSPPSEEFYEGGFWEKQPPPGLSELGQAGWTLLHTMAAYYPPQADEAKQTVTYQFLRSFGKVFPCTDCGRDFQRIMTEHPPRLRTRDEFAVWLCEAHNDVNAQLGKPAFPCSEALNRWRTPRAPH